MCDFILYNIAAITRPPQLRHNQYQVFLLRNWIINQNIYFLGSHAERAGDCREEGRTGGHEEEEPAGAGQGPGADQDADHEAGGAEGGAPDQRGQLRLHHLLPAGQADPGEGAEPRTVNISPSHQSIRWQVFAQRISCFHLFAAQIRLRSSTRIIICDVLLDQVEQSLSGRLQHLTELENAGPSAPLSDETDGDDGDPSQLYPSLPTMPRWDPSLQLLSVISVCVWSELHKQLTSFQSLFY